MTNIVPLKFQTGKQNPFTPLSVEGAVCEMTPSGIILNIYYRYPTRAEIKAVSPQSPLSIGIFDYHGMIFLLFNLNDVIDLECPFNANLYDAVFVSLNDDPNRSIGLHIILTDLNTNIIKSTRTVALTKQYEKLFFEKMNCQRRSGLIQAAGEFLTNMAYQEYPAGSMKKTAELYVRVV